jgi:hypothetical protein
MIKRNITILLTFTLLLFLIGCEKSQNSPKTARFLKILESGSYRLVSSISQDDETLEIETFVKGDKSEMKMRSNNFSIRSIVINDQSYIIEDEEKIILVSESNDIITALDLDIKKLSFVTSGTANFNGKTLPYDEYVSGSVIDNNQVVKVHYFVDGKRLAGWRAFIDQQGSVDVVVSILDKKIPKDAFILPSEGYEVINLSNIGL